MICALVLHDNFAIQTNLSVLVQTKHTSVGDATSAFRRRRSAASKGAHEQRSEPQRRRGRTRRAWSEGCQAKTGAARKEVKRQRVGRRDERRSGLESPFAKAAKTLDHEETRSEAAPLS